MEWAMVAYCEANSENAYTYVAISFHHGESLESFGFCAKKVLITYNDQFNGHSRIETKTPTFDVLLLKLISLKLVLL